MLILTADHDDRVVPAHSYKFAAELQHTLAAKLPKVPLMIRIDANSGHGAGKPVSKWVSSGSVGLFSISLQLKSVSVDGRVH